jgi:DNA-binding HxlR family transcriptional regulator
MARSCEILGDKWTLLVLREAFYGVTRFEDVRADLDAPRAALSSRLRMLVREKILSKASYREPGDRERFEYRLTEKGRALAYVMIALMEWGDEYLRTDAPPLELRDADSDEPLKLALATPSGRVRPLTALRQKLRSRVARR